MRVRPITTRIFEEGEDLAGFIVSQVKNLKERSVLVVTSKIVALSERRTAVIETIQTKERLIHAESEIAIPTKRVWLTVKDGMVMPAAGIDESNANGKLILLPKDSFKAANFLRRLFKRKYGLNHLGILITDSRTMPLRAGITGVALGYAGFRGVKDYRGLTDIFGRKLRHSRVDIADSLAAAAVMAMGEGDERRPLAVIGEAPIEFCDRIRRDELRMDIEEDMYRPLFLNLAKR